MPRIKVNVSGTIFEIDRTILGKRKGDRISELCGDISNDSGVDGVVYVDRSAKCFDAILTFYQTGDLHMPLDVCPVFFQQEMQFWRLDDSDLSECCAYRLNAFLDDRETRTKFTNIAKLRRLENTAPAAASKLGNLKSRLWSVIDYNENSLIAKIYFVFISTVVVASILSLALSTESSMRRPMTKCEILEYLSHSEHEDERHVADAFDDLDCDHHHFSNEDYDYMHNIFDEDGAYFYDEYTSQNVTIKLPKMTVPMRVFFYLDIVILVIFTIDIICRLVSCPSLVNYFLSIVNIVDAVAITSSYVFITILYIEREHRYSHGWIHMLNNFQVFRSLRLLRVAKNVRASQVLAYSLRQNFKDIAVLLLFIFFGVSTFACVIYFAEGRETIQSIPVGWYFSIITLTTVGYGDITPKTTLGLITASVCAVMGIVLLAVTVPIFVNNFLTLYQCAQIDAYADERRSSNESRKGKKPTRNTVSVIPLETVEKEARYGSSRM